MALWEVSNRQTQSTCQPQAFNCDLSLRAERSTSDVSLALGSFTGADWDMKKSSPVVFRCITENYSFPLPRLINNYHFTHLAIVTGVKRSPLINPGGELTRWPLSCPSPSPRSSGRGRLSPLAAQTHSSSSLPGSWSADSGSPVRKEQLI